MRSFSRGVPALAGVLPGLLAQTATPEAVEQKAIIDHARAVVLEYSGRFENSPVPA